MHQQIEGCISKVILLKIKYSVNNGHKFLFLMIHRDYSHPFFPIHAYKKRFFKSDMTEEFSLFNNFLFFKLFPV